MHMDFASARCTLNVMPTNIAIPATTLQYAHDIEEAAGQVRERMPASGLRGAVMDDSFDQQVTRTLGRQLKVPDVLERAFLFVSINRHDDPAIERLGVALAAALLSSHEPHNQAIGTRWMARMAGQGSYEARMHLALSTFKSHLGVTSMPVASHATH